MKVISLNTWGGRAGKEKQLEFFCSHADTDVFCLQEIWSAPYEHLEGQAAGGLSIDHTNIMVYGKQEISAALPSHTAFFYPHHLENYGLMTLVKNNLEIEESGELFFHKEKGFIPEGDVGHHARNLVFVTVKTSVGPRTVINLHGLWNGKGKGDSEDRLEQSKKILSFVRQLRNPFVICGDFNLDPNTESLKMFEKEGLRNLIKEYGITSTRTSYYKKEMCFADYVFVPPGVDVLDFKVLSDEVSDHAPLFLEFT